MVALISSTNSLFCLSFFFKPLSFRIISKLSAFTTDSSAIFPIFVSSSLSSSFLKASFKPRIGSGGAAVTDAQLEN
jgi:hypothetical protein